MQVNNHTQAYGINSVQNNKANPAPVTNSSTAQAQTDTVSLSHAGQNVEKNAEKKWQDIFTQDVGKF